MNSSMMHSVGKCLTNQSCCKVRLSRGDVTHYRSSPIFILCMVLWILGTSCGDSGEQRRSQTPVRDMRFIVSISMLCPSELKGANSKVARMESTTIPKGSLPAHITFEVAIKLPDCLYMQVMDSGCALHPSSVATANDCKVGYLAGLQVSIAGGHLRQRYRGGPRLHLTTAPSGVSGLKYAGKRSELIMSFASQLRRLFKFATSLAESAHRFQMPTSMQSISGRRASHLEIIRDAESGMIKRVNVYNSSGEVISSTQVKNLADGSIKVTVHMPRGIVRVMKQYLVLPDIAHQLVERINRSGGKAQLGGVDEHAKFSIGGSRLKHPRVLYHEEPIAFSGRIAEVTVYPITHGVLVPGKVVVRDEDGRLRMVMKFHDYRLNCDIPQSLFLLE